MQDWYSQGKNSIWQPYTQMKTAKEPLRVKATKGCRIILEDGRELIDGTSSWWSACHGYNNPHITQSIKQQLEIMPHVMFAGIAHEGAYKLADRLCKLTNMDKVFFTDSGSTAVETSMKMAVQYWKNTGEKYRNKFISFRGGYHGDTMGAMSLCDNEDGMHKIMQGFMPEQYNIKIPSDEYDFAEFEELLTSLKNNIAGVVIEPLVQGAGGMKFHSADILAEIYRITKKCGSLFIADEIMTGFGRTGHMFACEEAGIIPDITCIGKALTGGTMTLAATICKDFIFEAFLSDDFTKAFMNGPTFMANPLACAAANASLDLFEKENVLQRIEEIEQQMITDLANLSTNKNVKNIRVKGAIGVIELETVNYEFIVKLREEFIKNGVWLRPFDNVIYIMPPFIITKDELSTIVNAIYAALS